eukprot:CAMPEP_0118863724 /NCGR_PEP_ID=MMETSP1163-20130328/8493_1 /TAXON_ID=124430 /ORGANISM="Phaeomonas parva, Strain CCMP2877" /LENGTH=114 /DNA_ID=CAMNT_0006797755 /DNA_START=163 /DNA_END=505 /DNA_ORIENTATION=-
MASSRPRSAMARARGWVGLKASRLGLGQARVSLGLGFRLGLQAQAWTGTPRAQEQEDPITGPAASPGVGVGAPGLRQGPGSGEAGALGPPNLEQRRGAGGKSFAFGVPLRVRVR